MASVSISDLVTRVRAMLDERPLVTSGTLTSAGDLIATMADGNDWHEGAIMEWQDNGEQCLVQSVSGNDVTVVRSWNGTTAQTHTSITAYRDPAYTFQNVTAALTAAINRLWPHVWKTTDDTITPDTSDPIQTWYDLAADAYGIVSARQRYGVSDLKVGTFGDGRLDHQIIFERNLPTGVAASGVGVRFPNGFFHATNVVDIKYATPITGSSDIDDESDLNVAECVVYGALARILGAKEINRVVQGEDQEVSRSVRVGGRLSAGAYYERLFQREKEIIRQKLRLQTPIMPMKRYK